MLFEKFPPNRFVEQAHQANGMLIIHSDYHVGVPDIMNPGYMFVSDTLNPVTAKTIQKQCRALQRLGNGDF